MRKVTIVIMFALAHGNVVLDRQEMRDLAVVVAQRRDGLVHDE